jgi:segregation and condensation protein B
VAEDDVLDSPNLDSPNGHSHFEDLSMMGDASTQNGHVAEAPVDSPAPDGAVTDSAAGTGAVVQDGAATDSAAGTGSAVQLPLAPASQLDPRIIEKAGHLVAVLFVSGGPLKLDEAARAVGVSAVALEEPVRYLREQPPLGLMLQLHGDELELVSHPRSASCVQTLLGLDRPVRLSRAALETLSIIAYRQPVTRGDVESVRGVNSDGAVTTLLNRGLIVQVGRKETVGRPTLYATTPEFLQHLGMDSLDALPPLPK